jgi:hypothetical protein
MASPRNLYNVYVLHAKMENNDTTKILNKKNLSKKPLVFMSFIVYISVVLEFIYRDIFIYYFPGILRTSQNIPTHHTCTTRVSL